MGLGGSIVRLAISAINQVQPHASIRADLPDASPYA
jgi:hypothetical protein